MAKRNNTRISNGGGALVALAILLVAVIICGIITHGFKDWTPCACFGHKYDDNGICVRCKAEEPKDEKEQPKDNAVLSNGESHGITVASARLLNSQFEENGIDPQAESAYTLTASVEPAEATNIAVDWSVAFVDDSSTWASGKTVTNYVTVTPTSDGALTANVACKQAFGEQIVITCTARDFGEIKATCTVDYRKRVTNVTGSIGAATVSASGTSISAIPLYYSNASSGDINLVASYSVGTIENDDAIVVQVRLSDNAYNQFGSYGKCDYLQTACQQGKCNHSIQSYNKSYSSISTSTIAFNSSFIQRFSTPKSGKTSLWVNAVRNIFNISSGDVVFKITCGDYVREISADFNVSNWTVAVSNVTLDNSNLIF